MLACGLLPRVDCLVSILEGVIDAKFTLCPAASQSTAAIWPASVVTHRSSGTVVARWVTFSRVEWQLQDLLSTEIWPITFSLKIIFPLKKENLITLFSYYEKLGSSGEGDMEPSFEVGHTFQNMSGRGWGLLLIR